MQRRDPCDVSKYPNSANSGRLLYVIGKEKYRAYILTVGLGCAFRAKMRIGQRILRVRESLSIRTARNQEGAWELVRPHKPQVGGTDLAI